MGKLALSLRSSRTATTTTAAAAAVVGIAHACAAGARLEVELADWHQRRREVQRVVEGERVEVEVHRRVRLVDHRWVFGRRRLVRRLDVVELDIFAGRVSTLIERMLQK